MLAMKFEMKVVRGDFVAGPVRPQATGFELIDAGGKIFVPFGFVLRLRPMGSKRARDAEEPGHVMAGAVVGGVAGVLTAGLSVAAGSILGGLLGSAVAPKRSVYACQVMLRDGRMFIAVARAAYWVAFASDVRRAPPADAVRPAAMLSERASSKLGGALDVYRRFGDLRALPRLKPRNGPADST
jgi:hypothetical protein